LLAVSSGSSNGIWIKPAWGSATIDH
jgi:hypothetical protein